MARAEQFGMDPEMFAELECSALEITTPPLIPAINRNFGDDSDAEFRANTEVITSLSARLLPGETAIQAHVRLQQFNGQPQ
jgi:hypothetical protein